MPPHEYQIQKLLDFHEGKDIVLYMYLYVFSTSGYLFKSNGTVNDKRITCICIKVTFVKHIHVLNRNIM